MTTRRVSVNTIECKIPPIVEELPKCYDLDEENTEDLFFLIKNKTYKCGVCKNPIIGEKKYIIPQGSFESGFVVHTECYTPHFNEYYNIKKQYEIIPNPYSHVCITVNVVPYSTSIIVIDSGTFYYENNSEYSEISLDTFLMGLFCMKDGKKTKSYYHIKRSCGKMDNNWYIDHSWYNFLLFQYDSQYRELNLKLSKDVGTTYESTTITKCVLLSEFIKNNSHFLEILESVCPQMCINFFSDDSPENTSSKREIRDRLIETFQRMEFSKINNFRKMQRNLMFDSVLSELELNEDVVSLVTEKIDTFPIQIIDRNWI